MAGRYYPVGYIGIEEAAKRIAKARDCSLWEQEKISLEEQTVWNGINRAFNGLILNPHLLFETPESLRLEAYDRLLSYDGALQELRRHLHAGKIVAEFCDEHGRFDFIQAQGWGGEGANTILLTGVADLGGYEDGSVWVRLVLLKETDIQRLIAGGMADPQSGPNKAQPEPARARSGAVGRPTSMHIVIAEAERRVEAGERYASIRAFATALSEWVSAQQNIPRLTPKAMENNPEFKSIARRATVKRGGE